MQQSAPQPTPPPLSRVAARLLARARTEWQARQFDAAAGTLASVLALAPDHPDALRLQGMVAQRRGQHAQAMACYRKLLVQFPHDEELHVGLGIALFEHNEPAQALAHLKQACELAPRSASAWFNYGEALGRNAQSQDAVAALRHTLQLDPAHVSARLSLARIEASLGRINAAVAGYREVVRRDPANADGWFGLSNLNVVRFDAADADRLRHALARPGLAGRNYELLAFSYAKALESTGDFGQAYDVFARANASRRQRVTWDAAGEHRRVEAIMEAFRQPIAAPPDPQLGREVVLIVSIPRSGSTLVEHILASHPEVEGANEIKDLQWVVDAETARRHSAFPLWTPDASADDWQRLGAEYLARTARWRERKPRFTDKSLTNWYLVGAALAMLPAARVVVVRRDPVETCLGCFRQCFSEHSGFACDMDELAGYCGDFLRLTRFWLQRYPDRVMDLQYESLVADPEAQTRRLLRFCGLPFDQACIEFHTTARTVQSLPSAAQVRQPIRRDTARGALYGHKLDRLRERLRAAGVLGA